MIHLLFPRLLRLKDPSSGFFSLKRHVIENVKLKPTGFKILLEILIRGKYKRVLEISFRFNKRIKGESKLNKKEMKNILTHLLRLFAYNYFKI